MHLNIHLYTVAGAFPVTALLMCATPLAAQVRCTPAADSALQRGWQAYRANSLSSAVQNFERAHRLSPHNLDGEVGLGFARLRQDAPKEASAHFQNVLARDSASSDAWEGRARTSLRLFLVELLHPGKASIKVVPDYNRYDARVDGHRGRLRPIFATAGHNAESK